jgi:DnaJ-class molecular chaperone
MSNQKNQINSEKVEIVNCEACSGYGMIKYTLYEAIEERSFECEQCKGKGKLVKITSITYKIPDNIE